MNSLPESRRALYGRTYRESWSPGSMDPIERHPRVPFIDRVLGALLAVGFSITVTLIVVHELAR